MVRLHAPRLIASASHEIPGNWSGTVASGTVGQGCLGATCSPCTPSVGTAFSSIGKIGSPVRRLST